jgi:hypothetical protein
MKQCQSFESPGEVKDKMLDHFMKSGLHWHHEKEDLMNIVSLIEVEKEMVPAHWFDTPVPPPSKAPSKAPSRAPAKRSADDADLDGDDDDKDDRPRGGRGKKSGGGDGSRGSRHGGDGKKGGRFDDDGKGGDGNQGGRHGGDGKGGGRSSSSRGAEVKGGGGKGSNVIDNDGMVYISKTSLKRIRTTIQRTMTASNHAVDICEQAKNAFREEQEKLAECLDDVNKLFPHINLE